MEENKINLEKLLDAALNKANFDLFGEDKKVILEVMKEACRQTLELAAENAEGDIVEDTNYSNGKVVIDKQSILNIIDLIE